MNISIAITKAGQEAIQRMQAFPNRLMPAIAAGLDAGLEAAVQRVSAQRFTGKGPFPVAEHRLGVRTGRLRASLRAGKSLISGSMISNRVGPGAGTNVSYFGRHEFGFTGTERVSAHSRTRLGNTHDVRAHERRVNTPARAPLLTGLSSSESRAIIGTAISRSVVREWTGGAK